MPYIAREDGERFVIPSYRDVLSAKRASLLKKEILLLSENYGGFIALQRKNISQYEVAFSPDTGYLLGETVWHYFKRPFDLIYCEVIPNTAEAILVIVKSGSVYLDGSFPVDTIPEELVVFLTQQNNFDIYIRGDVPIGQTEEDGKFSFSPEHVKSFNLLTESVFEQLPKIKAFQLQSVDVVLKGQGIGALPIKKVLVGVIILALIWMASTYINIHKKELPKSIVGVIDPYQLYTTNLTSPAPSELLREILSRISRIFAMPGWVPNAMEYNSGLVRFSVKSIGTNVAVLVDWANRNRFQLAIEQDGFYLTQTLVVPNRLPPTTINHINDVIVSIVDRLEMVLPGNNLTIGSFVNKGQYKEIQLTITVSDITLPTLDLIAQQLNDLPLVASKIGFTFSNGTLSGTIILLALGN